jgi:hypothetical protein
MPQRVVVEGLDLGLTRIDGFHDRPHPLEIALVLGAENEGNSLLEKIHSLHLAG